MSSFPTGSLSDLKEQYIAENSNSKQIFLKSLQHFLDVKSASNPAIAATTSQLPMVNGKYLDLYELYHKADRRQGYEAITQSKSWRAVATDMGITPEQMPDENLMKEWYGKFLTAFETAIKRRSSLQASSIQNKRPLPQPGQMPAMTSTSAAQRLYPQGTAGKPLAMPLDASGQPLIKRAKTALMGGPSGSAPVFNQLPPPPPQHVAPQHHMQQYSHMQLKANTQASSGNGPASGLSTSMPSSSLNSSSSMPPSTASTSTAQSSQGQGALTSCLSPAQIHAAIRNIQSSDINKVHGGLNYLMQATMEADNPLQARNIVYIEKFPTLLTALGDLLDAANPFTKLLFTFTESASDKDCAGSSDNEAEVPVKLESQEGSEDKSCAGNSSAQRSLFEGPVVVLQARYDAKGNQFWRETNPLDQDNVLRVSVCCTVHIAMPCHLILCVNVCMYLMDRGWPGRWTPT